MTSTEQLDHEFVFVFCFSQMLHRCFGFYLNKLTSVFMFSAKLVHVNEKTLH